MAKWLERRKIICQTYLFNFLHRNSSMKNFLYMAKLAHNQIKYIQKWYRRIYLKRTIATAIINLEWSAMEYDIIKGTKKQDILSNFGTLIKDNYIQGKLTIAVPVKTRIKYIRSFLNVKHSTEIHIRLSKAI